MTLASDVASALIGGGFVLAAALVGIIPAVLAILRRTRGAVEADGTATRDALTTLSTQLTDVKSQVRADVYELRAHVVDVRSWQAGHDAEHLLIGRHERGGRGDAA